MQLPYRLCVGVLLVNQNRLVCVEQRLAECSLVAAPGSWQMPEGGMAPDEPARAAGLRLLAEDLGISDVQVLAEAPGWFTFELPPDAMGVALKGQYCGHKQKWIAVRALSEDRDTARTRRWVPAADVPRLAPALKRETYEDVMATFAPLMATPTPSTHRAPEAAQKAAAVPWFVTLFG